LKQISEIRRNTGIELESFVHGSLCVSYSGRCYMSAALGGRSANRGACGQPCRLPWTLIDAQGRVFEHNRHLLSLKDMDRSDYLSDLIASGITAFKIEGRLKDIAYVKNVTAFYRTRIDTILDIRPDLQRASSGRTEIFFTPNPCKTFHRGDTNYLLDGDTHDIWSPDTPKSIGEEIGTVTRCGPNWFELAGGSDTINPGDGLCFFDEKKELQGLQVVRVTGRRVKVHLSLNGLRPGMIIFRNHDHQFFKQLEGLSAVRRLALHLIFRQTPDGFELEGTDEDGIQASITLPISKEPAEKPEAAMDTIKKQLSSLAYSMFSLASLKLETKPYFLRTSVLNRLRRELITKLETTRAQTYKRLTREPMPDSVVRYPVIEFDYSYNISNESAREFYRKHGVSAIEPAFEVLAPEPGAVVMTTKHCLRRCLSACPLQKTPARLAEPLFIENNHRRFRLAFDCTDCRMLVVME
jgi:putative protease